MNFIDTHAHLYGEDFAADFEDVVERARLSGASKIFLPSTDLVSARMVTDLSKRFSGLFYPMIGLHPEDLPENYLEILQQMELQLKEPNIFIGIGEVGLDLYWNATRVQDQMRAFDLQICWAQRFGLPLMIHARSAHKELMQCLEPYRNCNISGVFHCFTGTIEEAAELLDFDHFMLGIGGVVTFKKSSLPEVLKSIPLSRLVLETDAPYMAPVPHRGKRNETSFLLAIIEKLAEIYKISTEEVGRITSENALKVFPLAR
ncbi:MAG: TatD family hydrolase [Bacteroidaceae bacterium]|jgi:TatD DNase family protein|nr:TatD family hydrolase [Bacteroidaceae bacterium]